MKPLELNMAEELWKKTNRTKAGFPVEMLPLDELEYAEWTEIEGNRSTPYYNVIRNYGTRSIETKK